MYYISRFDGEEYSYSCKCSGNYEIQEEEIDTILQEGDKSCFVSCDSCSLTILLNL